MSTDKIQALSFDLDNCLYPEHDDATADYSDASRKTLVAAYPQLQGQDITHLTKQSYGDHGNDIGAFAVEHGYKGGKPYLDLLRDFHRHALPQFSQTFTPQEGLAEALHALQDRVRFVIHTHASMEWAVHAVETMELQKYFPPESIFSQDHPDINGKRKDRDVETFHAVINHLGLAPSQIGFLDDGEKNHIIPSALGMHTVHVHWDNTKTFEDKAHVSERSVGPVPFLRRLSRGL